MISGIGAAGAVDAVKVFTASEGLGMIDILDWNNPVNLGAVATCGALEGLRRVAMKRPPIIMLSQHFLNFFPEPQWQGSFRPSFFIVGLYYIRGDRKKSIESVDK